MYVTVRLLSRVLLLVLLANKLSLCEVQSTERCESPQYVNYGETGILTCVFQEFFSILWYNGTDYNEGNLLIHYQDFEKSGPGYNYREFDILPSGSLVIKNVSLQHETTYTVVYVRTRDKDLLSFNVDVIVIVKPETDFPVINYCGSESSTCYAEISSSNLQCTVENAKPNVSLRWMASTLYGYRDIYHSSSISREVTRSEGYTTNAFISKTFQLSPYLVLLVCNAYSQSGMLRSNQSLILAQNYDIDITGRNRSLQYVQRYTNLSLECSRKEVGFIVWKKSKRYQEEKSATLLLYSIFITKNITNIYENDVILGSNGSLSFNIIDTKHEGLYYCIYGDGLKDDVVVYEVIIYQNPGPEFLTIQGCYVQQNCVLKGARKGNLTCHLRRIRPQVQLEWKTFNNEDTRLISFTNWKMSHRSNGETFDVTLTVTYRLADGLSDKLTLECKVKGFEEELPHLSTKMDLLVLKDDFGTETQNTHMWMIPVYVVSILGLYVLVKIIGKLFCTSLAGRTQHNEEETQGSLLLTASNQATEIEQLLRNGDVESIRQLCDGGIIISGHDDLSLQRVSMQLLKKAALSQISIELLDLNNCIQEVSPHYETITINKDFAINSRIPIKHLVITLTNRVMKEKEAEDILVFASRCTTLRKLWYSGCVPPRVFKKMPTIKILKLKKVTVEWQLFEDCPWYILNMETGAWKDQNTGIEPTQEDFEKFLSMKTRNMQLGTEDLYTEDVKIAREILRNKKVNERNAQIVTKFETNINN